MAQTTLAFTRDQISAFKAAIVHNRETLKRQLAERRLCDQDYYFLDGQTYELVQLGSHDMDGVRKPDDYIAGAVVGALPFLTLNGDDALYFDSRDLPELVELKLSMKDWRQYWVGPKGGICAGNPGAQCSMRSDINASYEVVKNLEKKDRPTFLVVVDKSLWKVIDCYRMEGSKIIEFLTTNMNTGEPKKSKKRDIKLGSFILHGQKVSIGIDTYGLEHWEDLIKNAHNRTVFVDKIRYMTDILDRLESMPYDLYLHYKRSETKFRAAIVEYQKKIDYIDGLTI